MSVASTAALGATGLLGLAMSAEGLLKLVGDHDEGFEDFGYPQWFGLVVGWVELVGGLALLGSIVGGATLALGGGAAVAVVLAGAVGSHLRVGDSAAELAPAAALLVLSGIVLGYHAGVLA